MFCFTELIVKQEEEIAEEADNSSLAPEDLGQTGDEGVALEGSVTGSPGDAQDGLSGGNAPADAGNRPPNGTNCAFSNAI